MNGFIPELGLNKGIWLKKEFTSELAIKAAENAFKNTKVSPKKLNVLL